MESTRRQAIVGTARSSVGLSAILRPSALALSRTVLLALLGWPASKWRLRVVLDVQLDRLGVFAAGDLAGQPQAEVDAGSLTGPTFHLARRSPISVLPHLDLGRWG